MSTTNHVCGYITICGRSNVGKSTLLNKILGEKLCITSNRPQTTRHSIIGVKTHDHIQSIYIDTPGLHRSGKRLLNKTMNQRANDAIQNVDIIIFVIEALQWQPIDEWVLQNIRNSKRPSILVINKIDKVKDKTQLLPFLERLKDQHDFKAFLPICARKKDATIKLEALVESYLPVREHAFPDDISTPCTPHFLAAEIIREKLINQLHHEIPYSLHVEIEQFDSYPKHYKIAALIWVETYGQKAIVIGKGGSRLKQCGQDARLTMETLWRKKVHLSLWVKLKPGWPDSPLNDYGTVNKLSI